MPLRTDFNGPYSYSAQDIHAIARVVNGLNTGGGSGGDFEAPVTTVNGKEGDVVLDKSDVGLGSVDNTPDAEKPVSSAQRNALNTKADLVDGKVPASQLPDAPADVATKSYVDTKTETLFALLGVGSTHGSGGAFTDTVSTFTASNSYSSGVRIYAADIDPNEPIGLLVHFHGDGGWEYDNPDSPWMLGGANGIRAQAKSRNMICVVANSPQDTGNRTWWEWSGSDENPAYARDLILDMYAKFNIDLSRVMLTGYSGGSQLLTKYLLTRYAADIFGGGRVVMFGGGGEPDSTIVPFRPAFPLMVPLHWCSGELDDGSDPDGDGYDALTSARAGMAWYESRSCQVSMETPEGYGHDLDGLFGPIVGEQLDLMFGV